jgi:EAL domain-containing protein (putative c-di-GMP-specific phosphodiesterase class I)
MQTLANTPTETTHVLAPKNALLTGQIQLLSVLVNKACQDIGVKFAMDDLGTG